MPSFTLLGSRIIRFPFILQTSYPHEVLHNWFGNGVYIHPDSGNWAEGLTTYLADHLLSEQRGMGGQYRFQELMKYSNYVNEKNDFPTVGGDLGVARRPPRGSKRPPRCPQEVPRLPKEAPKRLQEAPKVPPRDPRIAQEIPKRLQEAPKVPPRGPKKPRRGSQDAPKRLQVTR